MKRQTIGRLVSILVGAAVLFGLELGLDVQFYIAVPAGIVAYTIVKLAIGLVWGLDGRA
jgi:hypothetical protein